MPFRKNHEYCWKPDGEKALDPNPICFKMDERLKTELKAIPDWQKKLRKALPELIAIWQKENGNSSSTTPSQ